MHIAIASDHAGFDLKGHLLSSLSDSGHKVTDCGCYTPTSCDYPSYCIAAGEMVSRGDADFAIVLGGSGQGEQIAANKVKGVRAALCNSLYLARMARSHNNANVLAIGARVVGIDLCDEIVETFLQTSFEGGRHQRRIDLISAQEDRLSQG